MGAFPDYDRYYALGLADLIRKKEVSPEEVCEEAINRLEKIDPALNAVILRTFEGARRLAAGKLAGGPFPGVPFLIRDSFISYAVYLSPGRRMRGWFSDIYAGMVPMGSGGDAGWPRASSCCTSERLRQI